MMLFYLQWAAVLIAATYLLQLYIRHKLHIAPLNKVPGIKPRFLIGNILWMLNLHSKTLDHDPNVYIVERILGDCLLFQKTGMHLFWFISTPIITIFNPKMLEEVMNKSTGVLKSYEYRFLHPWLGQGLLTSTGSKWKTRRKLLTPAFHFRILDDFLPMFNEQSFVLIHKLKQSSHEDYVDISPLIVLCTLDVVCESVMGVHIGVQNNKDNEYAKTIQTLGDYFNDRMIRPWLWPDFIFWHTNLGKMFHENVTILHKFTNKVIKDKKEALLSKLNNQQSANSENDEIPVKKKAFMDLLLDLHINGQHLSEEDIREEVDTFMFEGHDTTAMSLIFTLYFIGVYPDVQKKIVEEIEEIFSGDVERFVTFDDTRKMKYLECVIKEVQRLCPPVPIIGRELDETMTLNGYTIPKGTAVHLNILSLHRNSDVFPNPEVFDPDRFLPENSLSRHPFSFIPFSAGPRNCIGQKFAMLEEKVIICNLLRHFEIISLDPRDKVHVKIEFTLRPAQPIKIKFIPRV